MSRASTALEPSAREPATPLYVRVARTFESQIENGSLKPGDRLPSVRELSRRLGISVSTAVAAFAWLERHGAIHARPKSGHYVSAAYPPTAAPRARRECPPSPSRVALADIVVDIHQAAHRPGMARFGNAVIAPELLPEGRLNRSVRLAAAAFPRHATTYESPAGNPRLRRQISRLAYRLACNIAPDEVIVTCGATEALNLGIRAVASPGDVVAVESPGCFEMLQALESCGMKALEIPARPRDGMDLDVLDSAIRRHAVKSILMTANCHNPLGYVLPDGVKADVVALARRHRIPIVEDDAFGDLAFAEHRPRPLKSFDTDGNVLYCASFSHLLAPGLHIGWVHAGRFHKRVEALKSITTLATATLPQLALAEFLESGGYERHLRKLTGTLLRNIRLLGASVARHFPVGTRATYPDGGYVLWVQLPRGIKGFDLYSAALEHRIGILPGILFSPSRRFRDCVGILCGAPWTEDSERAIATLGRLAGQQT
jgi:DNA-binding transcriptional MocR family regulator